MGAVEKFGVQSTLKIKTSSELINEEELKNNTYSCWGDEEMMLRMCRGWCAAEKEYSRRIGELNDIIFEWEDWFHHEEETKKKQPSTWKVDTWDEDEDWWEISHGWYHEDRSQFQEAQWKIEDQDTWEG